MAVGTTVVSTPQSKRCQFPEPKPKISLREVSGVVIGSQSSGRLHGQLLLLLPQLVIPTTSASLAARRAIAPASPGPAQAPGSTT
jgi:hypothetical protein